MDQHHYGRPAGAVARRRARRPGRSQAEAAERQGANDLEVAHHQRSTVGRPHHLGHSVRVPARDGGRLRRQNQARHDHDIYLLCAVRHVERFELSLANQKRFPGKVDL